MRRSREDAASKPSSDASFCKTIFIFFSLTHIGHPIYVKFQPKIQLVWHQIWHNSLASKFNPTLATIQSKILKSQHFPDHISKFKPFLNSNIQIWCSVYKTTYDTHSIRRGRWEARTPKSITKRKVYSSVSSTLSTPSSRSFFFYFIIYSSISIHTNHLKTIYIMF